MKSFLQRTWTDEQTIQEVEAVKKQFDMDEAAGVPNVPKIDSAADLHAVVKNLLWNIAQDRKIGALKNIQGRIWEEGYTGGDLHALVYPDAARFFSRSLTENFRVAIYSSGSRDAQRLLFKHSDQGDLRQYISCYFDTSVGQKRISSSYKDIVKSLGVDAPSEIVFVTDIPEEATAAAAAGLQTVIAVRPGNAALPKNHGFQVVSNFDELLST